jgi:hypothetical protein
MKIDPFARSLGKKKWPHLGTIVGNIMTTRRKILTDHACSVLGYFESLAVHIIGVLANRRNLLKNLAASALGIT